MTSIEDNNTICTHPSSVVYSNHRQWCCLHQKHTQFCKTNVQPALNQTTPAQRRRKQHLSTVRSEFNKWLKNHKKFNINKRRGIAFSTELKHTPHWKGVSHDSAYLKSYRLETLPPDTTFSKKTSKKQQLRLDRARRELESELQVLRSQGKRRNKISHFRKHKFLTPEYSSFVRPTYHIHKNVYSHIKGFKKYLPNKKSCKLRYRLRSGYFDETHEIEPINARVNMVKTKETNDIDIEEILKQSPRNPFDRFERRQYQPTRPFTPN